MLRFVAIAGLALAVSAASVDIDLITENVDFELSVEESNMRERRALSSTTDAPEVTTTTTTAQQANAIEMSFDIDVTLMSETEKTGFMSEVQAGITAISDLTDADIEAIVLTPGTSGAAERAPESCVVKVVCVDTVKIEDVQTARTQVNAAVATGVVEINVIVGGVAKKSRFQAVAIPPPPSNAVVLSYHTLIGTTLSSEQQAELYQEVTAIVVAADSSLSADEFDLFYDPATGSVTALFYSPPHTGCSSEGEQLPSSAVECPQLLDTDALVGAIGKHNIFISGTADTHSATSLSAVFIESSAASQDKAILPFCDDSAETTDTDADNRESGSGQQELKEARDVTTPDETTEEEVPGSSAAAKLDARKDEVVADKGKKGKGGKKNKEEKKAGTRTRRSPSKKAKTPKQAKEKKAKKGQTGEDEADSDYKKEGVVRCTPKPAARTRSSSEATVAAFSGFAAAAMVVAAAAAVVHGRKQMGKSATTPLVLVADTEASPLMSEFC